MILSTEILPYIDSNGLVAPNLGPYQPLKGSDNGPMFTAELLIMLAKRKELTAADARYMDAIDACIDPKTGLLNRVPIGKLDGQEGPDDYYGVLNYCKQYSIASIPKAFLKSTVRYLGFLNNENPGKCSLRSFLVRQPQLIAAMVSAAFPQTFNPAHILIRSIFFLIYLYTAIIIATSGLLAPKDDADTRRLAWHLVNTTKNISLLCFLASKLWYRRLYKQYGPTGMKAVAAYYYQDGHPFVKYWVD